MCQPRSARAKHPQPSIPAKAMPLISQAYVEKYKFTSVVAQDLLDSFLSFFPELKEQSVDCRAGEATHSAAGPRAGNKMAVGTGGKFVNPYALGQGITRVKGVCTS